MFLLEQSWIGRYGRSDMLPPEFLAQFVHCGHLGVLRRFELVAQLDDRGGIHQPGLNGSPVAPGHVSDDLGNSEAPNVEIAKVIQGRAALD